MEHPAGLLRGARGPGSPRPPGRPARAGAGAWRSTIFLRVFAAAQRGGRRRGPGPDRGDELHVGGEAERAPAPLDVPGELERVERGVGPQREDQPARAGVEPADAQRPEPDLHRHELEEGVDLVGGVAVAVHDLGPGLLELLVGRGLGEPLVEVEPLVDVGHVVVGDEGRRPAAGRRGRCPARGASPRSSRTASSMQLGVEVEADRLDLARLVLAEQVAGAADLEIVAGDVEAGCPAR